jgi:hypothetical protein
MKQMPPPKRSVLYLAMTCSRDKKPYAGRWVSDNGIYVNTQVSTERSDGTEEAQTEKMKLRNSKPLPCPFCGSQGFVICSNCRTISCGDQRSDGAMRCPCTSEHSLLGSYEGDFEVYLGVNADNRRSLPRPPQPALPLNRKLLK